jgi:hypothetical protein
VNPVTGITVSGAAVTNDGGGAATIIIDVPDSPDTPPVSPDPIDDEFPGTTLDGKWMQINYSSTVQTIAHSRLYLYDPIRTTRLVGIEQPISGNFRVRAKITVEFATQSYNGFGIAVKNSANGHYEFFGFLHHGSYGYMAPYRINLSSATAYVGETAMGAWIITQDFYMELENDGTNLIARYSKSGFFYAEFNRIAIATNLGAAPTDIGLFLHHYGMEIAMSVDWFRKVA